MAETTIEWADYTFNPWMGCTKVSPACAHCYAERDFDHRYQKVKWGPNGTRVLTSDANWRKPLKWNEIAGLLPKSIIKPGSLPIEHLPVPRPRVFCASLADVFEDWQGPIINSNGRKMLISYGDGGKHIAYEGQSVYPGGKDWCDMNMDDVRRRLFKLIDATPNLDWLLLTKRPENIWRMWPDNRTKLNPLPHKLNRKNVWLGTSVENQEQADKRIPELLKCRDLSPVLFLSCEPLLGPVEFSNVSNRSDAVRQLGKKALAGIDWVIAGGESGPDARPSHPDWFRSLRDQCNAANVPFLFKQWGEYVPGDHDCVTFGDDFKIVLPWHDKAGSDMTPVCRVGRKRAGRLLDGVTHDGFPEVTR